MDWDWYTAFLLTLLIMLPIAQAGYAISRELACITRHLSRIADSLERSEDRGNL